MEKEVKYMQPSMAPGRAVIAVEGSREAELIEAEVDAGEFRQVASFGDLAADLATLLKSEEAALEAAEEALFEEDEQAG